MRFLPSWSRISPARQTEATPRGQPIDWFALAVLLCVAVAVHAVLLFGERIFDNVDLRTHYQWATQFHQALADGTAYPRWMPLANGGLGEPSFVIVHPGWYWFVSALSGAGLEMWTAMRLAALASTTLLGFIVWLLGRERLGCRRALGAAVVMQMLPMPVFLLGYHAALPWHFSFPLLVWVVGLTVMPAVNRVDLRLSVAVALLSITHLLVAFMALLSLGSMLALRLVGSRSPAELRRVLHWVGAVVIGLGVTAPYWLLAATSLGLFSREGQIDAVYLNWRNSFVLPFFTSSMYGVRWAAMQWLMPIPTLLFIATASWMLREVPAESRGASWRVGGDALLVAVVAILLASEAAYPLYASIAFLQNVQWPYRFLTVSCVAAPWAAFLAWSALPPRAIRMSLMRWALATAIVSSVCASAALSARIYTEGQVAPVGLATMSEQFGQRGAEPAAVGRHWKAFVSAGGMLGECKREDRACTVLRRSAHHHAWTVDSPAEGTVRLDLFAFPAWTARVDGQPVSAFTDQATGVITVAVPAGRHVVTVDWTPLWQERVGGAVSVIFVGLVVFLTLWRWCVRGR